MTYRMICTTLLLLVAPMVCMPLAVAHDRMLLLERMATRPKMIFVGTVRSIEPRRVNKGLFMTTVTFEIDARVAGEFPEGDTIELEQPGAKVPEPVIEHDHLPDWKLGESYLVFARDPDVLGTAPTYGGETGFYRLVADADDPSILYPVDTHDRPIGGIRDGRFHLERPAREIAGSIARLSLAEPFKAGAPRSNDGSKFEEATFKETTEVLDLARVVELIQTIRGDDTNPLENLPPGGSLTRQEGGLAGLSVCWCGWHNIFLRLEQVPKDWRCYSNNEWSMAQFNYYVDLIRYKNNDGYWGPANSEDELAGFTSNEKLINTYGPEHGWDPEDLAKCVTNTANGDDCDRVRSADIHINPNKTWKYKFQDGFNAGQGIYFYDPTVIHEIGHALALEIGTCNEDYLFDRNTIMSAGPNDMVDTGKGLHRRDANALRTLYVDEQEEAETIPLSDMGVESWYMDGPVINGSIDPLNVQTGDTINTRNLVVENMSTWDIHHVRIRCFFSTNMTISEYDYESPTQYSWDVFGEDTDSRGDYQWDVPSDIPSGNYFVGVMVTRGGSSYNLDAVPANNTTFFPEMVTVEPTGQPDGGIIALDWDLILRNSFYANTASGTMEEQYSHSCPTNGQFGRSQFFEISAPIDGELHVLPNAPSYGEGFGQEPGPAIAVYQSDNGQAGQLIETFCATSASDPAIIDIQAYQSYVIQVATLQGDTPFNGWMNTFIEPAIPFGSAWEFPIEWGYGQDQTLGQEYGPPLDLPCISDASTMGRWYLYTAPCDGLLEVGTCNDITNFPSVVSIHERAAFTPTLGCGSWQQQSCSNLFGASASAMVTAGQEVLIRVATTTASEDMIFQLDVDTTRSENSLVTCDQAPTIEPGEHVITGTGTPNELIPTCEDPFEIPAFGTWRTLAGLENVMVTVTTCEDLGGSSEGTVSITLYGGDCSALTPLACNNHACSDGGAQLAITAPTDLKVHFNTTGAATVIVQIEKLPCRGDLNGDGIVNGVDLAEILGGWGQKNIPADINEDGMVNGADLAEVLGNWGDCD